MLLDGFISKAMGWGALRTCIGHDRRAWAMRGKGQDVMQAREQCLIHYGGDPHRCVWCGTRDGPVEIDHLDGGQGQGNRHRAAINGRLEYWLKRQGSPPRTGGDVQHLGATGQSDQLKPDGWHGPANKFTPYLTPHPKRRLQPRDLSVFSASNRKYYLDILRKYDMLATKLTRTSGVRRMGEIGSEKPRSAHADAPPHLGAGGAHADHPLQLQT